MYILSMLLSNVEIRIYDGKIFRFLNCKDRMSKGVEFVAQ